MTFSFSERYIVALNFLLVSAIAYLAAMSANDLIAHRLRGAFDVSVARRAPIVNRLTQVHPKSYYDLIAQRDIFNAVKAKEVNTPQVVVAADLHIRLLGTSHLTLAQPFAIIEDESSRAQSLYQLGDDIPNAGKLIAVEKERIIVDHNGQHVAVQIPENPLANAAAVPEPAPLPAMRRAGGDGIRDMGNGRYVVDRNTVNHNLQNMAQLFTQMRAIPNIQNGKTDGFKLSEIQPGSLFQQMGLLDGDVIKSVGGQELNDPTKAMQLLTMLRNQPSLNIDVIRNGRPVELSYDIR